MSLDDHSDLPAPLRPPHSGSAQLPSVQIRGAMSATWGQDFVSFSAVFPVSPVSRKVPGT